MTRHLLPLLLALGARAPGLDRADSAAPAPLPIDTMKAVTASDTLVTAADSGAPARAPATKASAPARSGATGATGTKTSTKLGRDSAFPPPRGLPKLDTVPTKRPPAH